jgi:peptidoglycan glycosyltransferase
MNRVASRAYIVFVLVLALLAGSALFGVDYGMHAKDWVMTSGSPHIYENNRVDQGVITDRDDTLLLSLVDRRVYSSDLAIRKSTMHWVGDRSGNVGSGILKNYASQIVGFDALSGTYRYGDTAGQMRLTLNAQVQAAALQAMGNYKGTVAVVNYKTGEIVCSVTTPTYDPDNAPNIATDASGAYEGVYMNRFLRSAYTPGSVFKIVTLAAALECMPEVLDERFTCTGALEFGPDKVTCERVHGDQSLKDAFCNSCNCVFGQLAIRVGRDRMTKYVRQFGLLDSIAFDGLTTVTGQYDVSGAADQELAWSGVGQYTDLINPCVFLRFVGAVGNGGVSVDPYVVQDITVGRNKTYEAEPALERRLMSAKTAETVAQFMGNNVQNKYGADNFPGMAVCAKTGTAEVGINKRPNAMFAGFVSDSELPLAFIACIEDGCYGAQVCIPVMSRVLAACAQLG